MANKSGGKNTLSVRDKIKIIELIDSGKKQSDVSKELGLPRTTVNSIWTRKKRILDNFKPGETSESRKRFRESKNPELESALLKWFTQMRSENVVINGPIFREKAKEMAKKMNIENFSCSEGWFTRFKERHGVVYRNVSGESGCVNVQRVTDWKKDLSQLIKDYDPRNIFNVDETGIFYKMMPSKSFHFRGEKCLGGKHSKQRISVLVGANCDGSEKLPLLIIGKYQNPRCFKGVKSLPTKYDANSKSWMTWNIFKKYVLELDKRFSKEKRQVLLFMDNCPAHQPLSGLEAVKIIFFPANCTSVLQPMDQGIIKSLKSHYRRILLGHLITAVECSKIFDVNVLEAMQWLQRSWQEVSAETIANCFHHAGFEKGGENSPDVSINEDFSLLENAMQAASAAGCDIPQGIDAATFINFDDDVIVSDKLSDEEIIQELRESKESETFSDSEEEMDNTIQPPTIYQIQNMLREMRKYYESKNEVSNKIFECIATLESDVEKRSLAQLKQKKMTEYISIV